jgi:DNA-binding NarL/FixJ family response regulator
MQIAQPVRRKHSHSKMSDDAKKIRVILVDDHPAVLHQTLQLLPERFEVVEALEDGLKLQAVARESKPDIVVLDITLPAINGVQLARQLRADGCKAKIIFLTVHADPDYASEAFHVGALGYVIKPRLASDLVPALDAVLAGRRFISPCPDLAEFR